MTQRLSHRDMISREELETAIAEEAAAAERADLLHAFAVDMSKMTADRDQWRARAELAERKLAALQSDIRRAWAVSRGEVNPNGRRVTRAKKEKKP